MADNDQLYFGIDVDNTIRDDIPVEDDAPRNENAYEDRVVAFLDILGFSELIRASKAEPNNISKIVDALKIAASPEHIGTAQQHIECHDIKISTFSDCVVVSAPNDLNGLTAVVITVWMITKDWLSKGFLSRGGISCGHLLHTTPQIENQIPSVVFGPAFLEAYQTEHQVADVARVLLHKSARLLFDEYKKQSTTPTDLSQLIVKCSDGPYAVDVFAHLRTNGFPLGTDPRPEAEQFKSELQLKLVSDIDTPRHFAKIKWLVEQFNGSVDNTDLTDLKICI